MTRTTLTARPASDKQLNFIQNLIVERLTEPTLTTTRERLAQGLTSTQASAWIDRLLDLPKLAPANNTPTPDVPEGRYAVDNRDGVLRFYRVDKPAEGKWAGRTFVSVQASDDWFPVRNRDDRNEILNKIAQDPKAASIRYGHELGVCGICGRTLTDETSRERGIGPICAEKVGW